LQKHLNPVKIKVKSLSGNKTQIVFLDNTWEISMNKGESKVLELSPINTE